MIGYINENGLQPGDRLPNEVDLMNKLKVGRGTIREAIKV
ncbi:MAG: GntR family transcriptional regulator [Thomasclavelia ramosa]